jgi:nucleotide-binding universal stress UspA family protein
MPAGQQRRQFMFKHILVPTDGSELSQATAKRAVAFAREAGARITLFFAKPEYPIAYFGEGALIDPTSLDRARAMDLDPMGFLENNDAHSLFEKLGDQVITGPTHTNVNDFRGILIR